MIRRTLTQLGAIVLVLYMCFCVFLGILLANGSMLPARVPLANASAVRGRLQDQFHASVEDVSISAADGALLKAWFVQPPAGNGKSVILLHGLGANRTYMAGFSDIFLSRGYSVLLPDSRDHGDSGGKFITYGILERDDVRRWAEWMRPHAPGCMYLMGESMGAAIALQAAPAIPQLCAVAVESPFSTFREISYDRVAWGTHTSPLLWRTAGRPVIEFAILYTLLRHRVYLPNADPEESVAHSSTPALLIAGTADKLIPMHNAQELEKVCSSHCSLWIVPGADHGGASTVASNEFGPRVAGWFQDHQASPPAAP